MAMSENTVSYTTNPAIGFFPDWQPIETAPEDVYVLIATTEAFDSPVAVAKKCGCWELSQTGSYAEDSQPNWEPTHWMPLPAMPEAKR